jgi:uncharacterized membrane-anchored protein YhcB (DUF1043 family)
VSPWDVLGWILVAIALFVLGLLLVGLVIGVVTTVLQNARQKRVRKAQLEEMRRTDARIAAQQAQKPDLWRW